MHLVVTTVVVKVCKFHFVARQIRQRVLLKCLPCLQQNYFLSLNQLYYYFGALPLLLPSSLLKLPILSQGAWLTGLGTRFACRFVEYKSCSHHGPRDLSSLVPKLTLPHFVNDQMAVSSHLDFFTVYFESKASE